MLSLITYFIIPSFIERVWILWSSSVSPTKQKISSIAELTSTGLYKVSIFLRALCSFICLYDSSFVESASSDSSLDELLSSSSSKDLLYDTYIWLHHLTSLVWMIFLVAKFNILYIPCADCLWYPTMSATFTQLIILLLCWPPLFSTIPISPKHRRDIAYFCGVFPPVMISYVSTR